LAFPVFDALPCLAFRSCECDLVPFNPIQSRTLCGDPKKISGSRRAIMATFQKTYLMILRSAIAFGAVILNVSLSLFCPYHFEVATMQGCYKTATEICNHPWYVVTFSLREPSESRVLTVFYVPSPVSLSYPCDSHNPSSEMVFNADNPT
jgi:hypothetical protein